MPLAGRAVDPSPALSTGRSTARARGSPA